MYYYPDTLSCDEADSVYKTSQYQVSWLNNYQVTDPWSVGAGVDWRRDVLHSDSESSGSAFFDEDKGRNNVGTYVLSQYHWEQWLGELSGRSSHNQHWTAQHLASWFGLEFPAGISFEHPLWHRIPCADI